MSYYHIRSVYSVVQTTCPSFLLDMFPQYDRSDLLRELRARGSAEAVVESVFLGLFSGTPRLGAAPP